MNIADLPQGLLDELFAHGVSVAEIEAAGTLEQLDDSVWVRILRGGPEELDLAGIAAAAGADLPRARSWLQAAGLRVDDQARYRRADVDMLRVFARAAATFGEELGLGIARLCGSHLAAVADGMSAVAGVAFEPLTPADRIRGRLAARPVIEAVDSFLPALLRLHVVAARRRALLSRQAAPSHDTRQVAVGFVDLVGFTPTAVAINLAALSSLVDRFEPRATEILGSYAGRVVKFIGYAVMFINVRSDWTRERGHREAWVIVGRRGGKSRGAALLTVYAAANHRRPPRCVLTGFLGTRYPATAHGKEG